MATKKSVRDMVKPKEIPETLNDHIFYSLTLTDEQKDFRDAIYAKDIDIILCKARAGTGKTLIAVATAMIMYEYGLIDEIIYMMPGGVYESRQGYLPGTLEEKNAYMCVPLRQALITLGYDPNRVIKSDISIKEGACITAQSDSYIRGCNIGDATHKTILIVDEAQNYSPQAMRTVLTRLGVGSKAIVIGDIRQCDLMTGAANGFTRCLNIFDNKEYARRCELKKCFRSRVADEAESI